MSNNVKLIKKIEAVSKEAHGGLSDAAWSKRYGNRNWQSIVSELIEQYTQERVEEAYNEGYNDNSRDCYCNSPGATEGVLAHRHLVTDGQSHDIRPDIATLTNNKKGTE